MRIIDDFLIFKIPPLRIPPRLRISVVYNSSSTSQDEILDDPAKNLFLPRKSIVKDSLSEYETLLIPEETPLIPSETLLIPDKNRGNPEEVEKYRQLYKESA